MCQSTASSFDPYSWRNFYFRVDREEANRLLCNDQPLGTFLIRDSTSPGSYALSVREYLTGEQQVRHYLIEPVESESGKTFVKMVALYSFEGEQPSDLAFQRNDVLEIIGLPEEKWWEARNALGATGLVPANYLIPLEDVLVKGESDGSGAFTSSEKRLSAVSVTSEGDGEDGATAIVNKFNLPCLARVKLDRRPNIYDTEALRLKRGQIIEVTKVHESGVCEGTLNGKVGTFPFTYVEFDSKLDSPTAD